MICIFVLCTEAKKEYFTFIFSTNLFIPCIWKEMHVWLCTLQPPPPLTLRFAQKIQSPSFSSAATSVEFAPCWIFFLYSMHNCVSLWNVPKSPKGIDPCIRWPISYPLKKIPETKVNKEDKLTSLLCWSGFQRRSQIPRGGLKESHTGLMQSCEMPQI